MWGCCGAKDIELMRISSVASSAAPPTSWICEQQKRRMRVDIGKCEGIIYCDWYRKNINHANRGIFKHCLLPIREWWHRTTSSSTMLLYDLWCKIEFHLMCHPLNSAPRRLLFHVHCKNISHLAIVKHKSGHRMWRKHLHFSQHMQDFHFYFSFCLHIFLSSRLLFVL